MREDGYRRVVVVEDHLLQRKRTIELLTAESDLQVVGNFETLPDFMAWLPRANASQRPHLLILDLVVERGPGADPDRVREILDAGIRVLVLSALASASTVRDMISAGVRGFVGKRDAEEDIIGAAWALLNGEEWISPELASVMAGDPRRPALSEQEERLLILYASGVTLPEAAAAIGAQPGTAKVYLARIRSKYAAMGRPVRSKIALSHAAFEDGFLGRSKRPR